MKPNPFFSGVSRRALLSTLAALPALAGTLLPNSAPAQTATSGGPLPSWNDGAAKQAIIKFVRTTTDKAAPTTCRRRTALLCSTRTARCG